MDKKIAMVIAHDGFRDEEYWVPKEIFEQRGIEVITVSSATTPANSKFNKSTTVDKNIGDIKAEDIDVLLFVGGPGTNEYFHNLIAHKLAKDISNQNKLLTAICIAPVILAHAGLLQGKQATVFSTGEEALLEGGAAYTAEKVTEDGNIITANGPESAKQFAEAIIERLKE